MGFELKGFDELEKKLLKMQKSAEELSGTRSVSFDDLFTASFMEKYSNFISFDKFLEAGKFIVNSQKDFKAIPDNEMDLHVSKTTNFSSWKDMLVKANEELTFKKLGL